MIKTEGIKLNSKGQNKNIKAVLPIDEEKLKELGFTNYNAPFLYFNRNLHSKKYDGTTYSISFNCNIQKATGRITIEILDDAFCQHYNYQSMIINGDPPKVALEVHEKVQELMKWLMEENVITGYTLGDYI